MKEMIQKFIVFVVFLDFGGSGDLPEAASKKVPKKTSKTQFHLSVLGSYFGSFFAQNRIRSHFVGVYFSTCFWHCFWGASGTNLVRFGVNLENWVFMTNLIF